MLKRIRKIKRLFIKLYRNGVIRRKQTGVRGEKALRQDSVV